MGTKPGEGRRLNLHGWLIAFIVASWVPWGYHIIVCIQTSQWLLLIAGAIMPPIGIVHGIGAWFGAW